MEGSLEKCIDDIMQRPDVAGIICTDSKGLLLSDCGLSDPEASSGAVAAVAEAAAAIEPTNEFSPVILIEGESSKVSIHRTHDLTLAVYKTYPQQRH